MGNFKRGQSVYLTMPSGKVREGFIKGVPGDTYADADGEPIILTDRFWVKYWSESRDVYGGPVHRSYATVRVPADKLAPREASR